MKIKSKTSIIKTIGSLLLVFLFSNQTFASHILGSEITYQHISGNRYSFQLKVYRDCNECKIGGFGGGNNNSNCNEIPNLQVRGALGTSYSNLTLGTIEVLRTAVYNRTSICNTARSVCSQNPNVNFGFEEHVFEGVFDFSNLISQNYCKFDVSISLSSRNIRVNPNTAEQNFFNFAMIDICSGINNQSTVFELPPNFLFLINQSNFSSLGVINKDSDSLSFKLRTALINRTSNVSYNIGRSFSEPFNYYCSNGNSSCAPNFLNNLVEGFYLSNQTGDLAFTPMIGSQAGVIVVECEEWKKNQNNQYFLAGITRRDVFSEVISNNNSLPKFKFLPEQINICENDSRTILVEIEDLMNLNLVPDSVFLSVNSDLTSGINWRRLPNKNPFTSVFEININHNQKLYGDFFITFNAKDNACPMLGQTSKTIKLKLLKQRDLKIDYNIKNCGQILFQTTKSINQNAFWSFKSIDGRIIKNEFSRKLSSQITENGLYIIECNIPNSTDYCDFLLIDTIVINQLDRPELDLISKINACKNSEIQINPIQMKTTGNYELRINDSVFTHFPFNYLVNKNEELVFKLKSENGCFVEKKVNVELYKEEQFYLNDTHICLNQFNNFFQLPIPKLEIQSNLKSLELEENNLNFYIENINQSFELHAINLKTEPIKINYRITDINNCVYNKEILVEIKDTPTINSILPSELCENQFPYTLPMSINTIWQTDASNSEVLENRVLNRVNSSSNIDLKAVKTQGFCKSIQSFSILVLDTIPIQFDFPNQISMCENQNDFELKVEPNNGLWIGGPIENGFFKVKSAIKNEYQLLYEVKHFNQCISKSKLEINIDRIPKNQINSNKDSICYGDQLSLWSTNIESKGYWFTEGEGSFDQTNSYTSKYIPSKNDVKKGNLNFIYTIQTNNSCGNVAFSKTVFIKDGPKGSIFSQDFKNKCEPAILSFSTDFGTINQQNWYINDSLVETYDYNFPVNLVLNAGDYVVKTSVKDGSCSAMAISEPFSVLPKPEVKFISNPNSRLSKDLPRLHLKDQSYSRNGTLIQWFLNDSLISNQREINILVEIPQNEFNIKLIAETIKGSCKDSLIKPFVFIPIYQLFIPDAFSPDAKGPEENNTFKILGSKMKVFEIEIFNRFGEKVFISNDQTISWDGTFKGVNCQQGVYFYKIITKDVENNDRDYSGTVTLIR